MSEMQNKDLRGHVEFLQANELNSISYSFGDLSPGLRAFELTGTPEKIDAFADLMVPLGLEEIARTGVAALSRG